ncbi:hypothetical protein [Sphingomonas sp. Marseille-Q8236]
MKKFIAALAVVASVIAPICVTPASAQMAPQIVQIGVDNFGNPICNGPQGIAPCVVIMNWLQNGGMQQMQMPRPMPMPMPQQQPGPFNGGMGPMGPAGIPTNIVPRDGQIVGQIVQQCGPNPACVAGAWGSVELSRCANGIGVAGGCFGPNSEVAKAGREVEKFFREGPGPNNELCKIGLC